ncbi:MAG TPA: hypothetical protein VFZ61_01350 [Polyangiales bacterium]
MTMLPMHHRLRSACAALLALLSCAPLGSCADDEGCLELHVCDIAEPSCQREVFASTACERGQPQASMPKVRAISQKQYAEELAEDEGTEDFQARAYWRALSLFGVLPEQERADDAAIENQVNNVLAYYSPETKDITVINRAKTRDVDAMLTLSHEFTHALQDQRDDLKTFMETHADSYDAALALRCLVEGEAEVASDLTMGNLTYGDARQVNWELYFRNWLTSTLEKLAEDDAPYLATGWLVYPVGTRVVMPKYRREGPSALRGYYREPPITFRSWTNQTLSVMPPEPMDCAPPDPPEGYVHSIIDRQGMAGLLALYVAMGEGAEFDASHAWVSDWLAVYTSEDESTEDVAVAWRLRFGSAQAAQAFETKLAHSDVPFGFERSGQEVLLTAASSGELYASWELSSCSQEKSRTRSLPRYRLPNAVRARLLGHRAHGPLRARVGVRGPAAR